MLFNLSILYALIPIFLVILSGSALRRAGFPGDAFWPYAERITYFVLFPCLLFLKTSTAVLDASNMAMIVKVLFSAITVVTVILFTLARKWPSGPAAFTSFFQGSVRINTYIGLSAAFGLYGDRGANIAAILVAVLIPFLNLLSVSSFSWVKQTGGWRWQPFAKEIIRNPMILACTGGLVVNLSGLRLHLVLLDTLDVFASASLPMGLMAVGAGLRVQLVRAAGLVVVLNCLLKLILLPVIVFSAARFFNAPPMTSTICVLFAALPGSYTSYILSTQLGGDSSLMASIVTAQIVASMITLPLIIGLLGSA